MAIEESLVRLQDGLLDVRTDEAATEMLDSANAFAADVGRPAIDLAAVREHFELEGVWFGDDGSVALWFAVGELFGDHGVKVDLAPDGARSRVEIV